MNGAESLLRTAAAAGVEICFANPGTTEIPIVTAFDRVQEIRPVLCLFEGVCTGAADGYGRMAGRPALTLLHLGPGFANGIAYLHDARRARSPIVNVIGDHATWHLPFDAPLTSDIVSLAAPVSAWLRTCSTSQGLASEVADAVAAASCGPGRIATLIVPHDCQLGPGSEPVAPRPVPPLSRVADRVVAEAAEALRGTSPAALYLGGLALGRRGLDAAARIAAQAGCDLICETFPARMELGAGTPDMQRLPYFPEQGIALLSRYRFVLLAGAREPVSFFGYPGLPSLILSPQQGKAVLASPDDDVVTALESLADLLDAKKDPTLVPGSPPLRPSGTLNVENFAAAVLATIPEGAIIMDEANTCGLAFFPLAREARPFTWLTQPGGAIGLGPPCATGAALACPDRPVITLQADGSAMYTLQSLWTQAREGLNVTTVLCNNRSYRILGIEVMRSGAREFGPRAQSMIDLTRPPIDWVRLASGLGVPGARVETAEDLSRELEKALSEAGPHLIEAGL